MSAVFCCGEVLDNIENDSVAEIDSGTYYISNTIKLENLHNVTIKGKNNVILKGGVEVKNFTKLKDKELLKKLPEKSRNKVFAADISNINLPVVQRQRGNAFPIPKNTVWVYANGKPLKETRYPREGFLDVDKVIQRGTKDGEPSVFEYKDKKFDKWTEEKDIYLFGYFRYLWSDASLKVDRIDSFNKTITLKPPYFYADEALSNETGIIYYAKNIFSEMDKDTFYIDREKKILYVYFSKGFKDRKIEISSLADPVIEINNCSDIKFENITFDMGQNGALKIKNSENIVLDNLKIKNFSNNGIEVRYCKNVTVSGCEIFNMGRAGIVMRGEDFDNLLSCNYVVENCNIHHFGLIDHTYVPAVHFNGVGLRVSHNEFHHCPSSVINIAGCEVLFEYNYVHNACQESDDQGAIDIYGNSSFRGNVYRYNMFENNGYRDRKTWGNAGIRFDDTISGQYVYGNIFKDSATGDFGCVQINSGRDNRIENNIFTDSKAAFSGGFNLYNKAWKEQHSDRKVNYTSLFMSRYPEMKNVYDEEGNVRKDGTNYFKNNIIVNCQSITPKPRENGWANFVKPLEGSMENNIVLERKYIDRQYRIKKDLGFDFKEIPFNEIGIKKP